MSQQPTAWYLTIRKGPKAGSTYPLPGGSITLGRRAGNHIVIDEPMVSPHHARITWQGSAFLLEDMGSANGTWASNVRITSPVSLRSGDLIGLSQEVLLVFSDQPQADETMHDASALRAAAPAAEPPSPPPAAPAARSGQGWLAFGLGGLMAGLGVVALAVVRLAIYLFVGRQPQPPTSQAVLPTSTPVPTAAAIPTEAPTYTPYPTYTPIPTDVPTATPYPTYTPYPTDAPTAAPYPTFISAKGRPLPSCYHGLNYTYNTAIQPGESTKVTFVTHLESDDWMTALVFDELNYMLTICFDPSRQVAPCR